MDFVLVPENNLEFSSVPASDQEKAHTLSKLQFLHALSY